MTCSLVTGVDPRFQSRLSRPNHPSFVPNPHWTRTRNASRWNLLMWLGASTLHTSNIKGFAFEFVRTCPVWIGPEPWCLKMPSFWVPFAEEFCHWGFRPNRNKFCPVGHDFLFASIWLLTFWAHFLKRHANTCRFYSGNPKHKYHNFHPDFAQNNRQILNHILQKILTVIQDSCLNGVGAQTQASKIMAPQTHFKHLLKSDIILKPPPCVRSCCHRACRTQCCDIEKSMAKVPYTAHRVCVHQHCWTDRSKTHPVWIFTYTCERNTGGSHLSGICLIQIPALFEVPLRTDRSPICAMLICPLFLKLVNSK